MIMDRLGQIELPLQGLWAGGTGYLRHKTTDYEAWIMEDVVDCARGVIDQLGDNWEYWALHVRDSLRFFGELTLAP